MASGQISRAFDLLGQAKSAPWPVRLPPGENPKLTIGWGSFRHGLGSSIRALLAGPRAPKKFIGEAFFKDCWVERSIPQRALIAAALWHVVFLVLPYPRLPPTRRTNIAFENTQLTWSGPINDFPLLDIPAAATARSPRPLSEKPSLAEEVQAVNPRQRIFTNPVRPNHPRQTLINHAAPPEPPKLLPNLPNIVQFQPLPGPAKPRLQINEEALAKLRPNQRRAAGTTAAPVPEIATFEQKPAQMIELASPNAPARPKLEINAGVAPRGTSRKPSGDAGPAPDVMQSQAKAATITTSTLIALSATPAPPASVTPPPNGNLAARIAVGPEIKSLGTAGGSSNTLPAIKDGGESGVAAATSNGAIKNSVAVSISGGDPRSSIVISGAGTTPKFSAPVPHKLVIRPDMHVNNDDVPVRTGPPNFAALPPGAKPEQMLASKKIYTLQVNMPNLNSATGSWIMNFSELQAGSNGTHLGSTELAGPLPLKKVDPKFPQTLINEHVDGEVVLYAVIRGDGSVDSIQLVRGLEDQLDSNAMLALSQWKFRPAEKQGAPVDLEAIVHIPFHITTDRPY